MTLGLALALLAACYVAGFMLWGYLFGTSPDWRDWAALSVALGLALALGAGCQFDVSGAGVGAVDQADAGGELLDADQLGADGPRVDGAGAVADASPVDAADACPFDPLPFTHCSNCTTTVQQGCPVCSAGNADQPGQSGGAWGACADQECCP